MNSSNTPSAAQTLDEPGDISGRLAELQHREQHLHQLVQASERRFRATFEQAAVGIALVKLDGTWLQVNRRLCELLGYTAEELGQLGCQEISHPEDAVKDGALINQMLVEDIQDYSLEKRFIRKDGEMVWTNLTMSLVRDEAGQPDYFVMVVEDIHAHKLAHLALDANRALLEEAQHLAHLGSWELELVTGVLSWSDEIYRIFEIDKAKFGASYAAFLERIHPEDRDMVNQSYTNSVQDRTSYGLTHRLLLPDGRIKYVHERGVTFYADDGTPLRSIGTAQDITERVLAENRLAEALERNRQSLAFIDELVNTANVMVVGLDDQGRVMLFNEEAEKGTGYRRRDVVGQDWFSLVVPRARFPEVWATFDRIRQGGEFVRSYVNPIVTASGEERLISWQNSRLKNADGQWVTVAFGLDITESHRAAEATEQARRAAEQANQAKSDFLANMSHEIRTPMNAIIGMGQLALAAHPSANIADYLRKIQSASRSLLAILNDVLDYSKIESGHMQIDVLPFRLSEVLHGVEDMFASRAENLGVQFSVHVASDVPDALVGDPLRLGQVLNNVVGNAIKFTEQGGVSVSVTLESVEGDTLVLRFAVEDAGIGISEDQLTRLFQPFSQADGSISRRYGGTGLGLAISRNLLEQMGGTLSVVSTPGVGSVFSFTVSLQADPERAGGADDLPRNRQQAVTVGVRVEAVQEEIPPVLPRQSTEIAPSSHVATALDAMWRQLNEHELVSDELIEQLAEGLQGQAQSALFKRLRGQIEQFNYEAALTTCSELHEQLYQAGAKVDAN